MFRLAIALTLAVSLAGFACGSQSPQFAITHVEKRTKLGNGSVLCAAVIAYMS